MPLWRDDYAMFAYGLLCNSFDEADDCDLITQLESQTSLNFDVLCVGEKSILYCKEYEISVGMRTGSLISSFKYKEPPQLEGFKWYLIAWGPAFKKNQSKYKDENCMDDTTILSDGKTYKNLKQAKKSQGEQKLEFIGHPVSKYLF